MAEHKYIHMNREHKTEVFYVKTSNTDDCIAKFYVKEDGRLRHIFLEKYTNRSGNAFWDQLEEVVNKLLDYFPTEKGEMYFNWVLGKYVLVSEDFENEKIMEEKYATQKQQP